MGEPEFGEAFAFTVPGWRALGLVALAAALVFGLFGLLANFDRTATVRGIAIPSSGISRIAAPQAGVVTAVLTRQGALVHKDAPLVRIASTAQLPTGTAAAAEQLDTYRRQQLIARQERQAEQQREGAERVQLVEQMAQLSATGESLRAQAALQQQRIVKNEQRLKELGVMRDKGYVPDVTYLAQEEALLSLRQQLAVLRQRQAETSHSLAQNRSRLAGLDASSRRSGLQSAASLLQLERGAAAAQVEAETTLAAPVSGRIASLRATPGMTVAASEELAALIPADARIEILLFVPSSAAGSVRPGQEVTLRFDAFPYQRYGTGRAIIREVASATTLEGGRQSGPSYRVRAAIMRMPSGTRGIGLQPDMTLSASIVLERRSLLDWLFAPLREKWRESRVRATGRA